MVGVSLISDWVVCYAWCLRHDTSVTVSLRQCGHQAQRLILTLTIHKAVPRAMDWAIFILFVAYNRNLMHLRHVTGIKNVLWGLKHAKVINNVPWEFGPYAETFANCTHNRSITVSFHQQHK